VNYLPENITYLKKKRGETNASIGLHVKRSTNTISNWVNRISEPGIEELQLLTQFLGCNVDEIINVDLSNVHLNEKKEEQKKVDIVHLNVHGNVHLKGKKTQKTKILMCP
jgi:transcriptional regulator with XRE-family HTH domain